MLARHHGLQVSRETVRGWMTAAGLWLPRAARRRLHRPRLRREAVGELIQIDGSDHRWFEDRGPACTLLVFIDDATSTLMQLRFVPAESAFACFEALEHDLQSHGRPVAFSSDRHSVFRVNAEEARSSHGMTQFGRALNELNIEILCAASSQAKGRVERANRTLQDRLVKELRLAGVSDIAAGNAFLPGFTARFNRQFATPPARQPAPIPERGARPAAERRAPQSRHPPFLRPSRRRHAQAPDPRQHPHRPGPTLGTPTCLNAPLARILRPSGCAIAASSGAVANLLLRSSYRPSWKVIVSGDWRLARRAGRSGAHWRSGRSGH